MKSYVANITGGSDSYKTAFIKAFFALSSNSFEENTFKYSDNATYYSYNLDLDRIITFIELPEQDCNIENIINNTYKADISIFIIDTVEGITQTIYDQLKISEILSVKNVIIVINTNNTPIDINIDLLKEQIYGVLKTKSFDSQQILEVDISANEDMQMFNNSLESIVNFIPGYFELKPPRLYVEYTYLNDKKEVIVWGKLLYGQISVGDIVEISPYKKTCRINSIRNFNNDIFNVYSGNIVHLNLGAIEAINIEKGNCIVRPGMFRHTNSFDALIELLPNAKYNIENNDRIQIVMLANSFQTEIKMINTNSLSPGESCYARINLPQPRTCCYYDKFIMLDINNNNLIGHGLILRPYPDLFTTVPSELVNILNSYKAKDFENVILRYLQNEETLLNISNITENLPYNELGLVDSLLAQKKIISFSNKVMLFSRFNQNASKILAALKKLHNIYPDKAGFSSKYLSDELNIELEIMSSTLFYLLKDSKIKYEAGKYSLYNHRVKRSLKELLFSNLVKAEFKKNLFVDIKAIKSVEEKLARNIIQGLMNKNVVVEIDNDIYISIDKLESIKDKIRKYLEKESEITPAQCRDLLGSSRKFVIPLLEYLDKIEFTHRVNGHRIIK